MLPHRLVALCCLAVCAVALLRVAGQSSAGRGERDEPAIADATRDAAEASQEGEDAEDEEPAPSRRGSSGSKRQKMTREQSTPTHKQWRVIKPMHNDAPVTLETFCLDAEGNLLACIDGRRPLREAFRTQAEDREPDAFFVQRYSPEGTLLEEISLPFNATAINVGPKGEVFVAGAGKMARIVEGKVTSISNTPQVGDHETMVKKVRAAAEKEKAEYREMFKEQTKFLDTQIEKLKSGAKDRELTKREKAKLETLEASLAEQNAQIEALIPKMSEEEMIRSRLIATALGVTSQDVFVSVRGLEGHGYEVWRTNHDFEEPKRVVSKLSGCCGQLDIQARDDRLFIAENGKFKISVRDRDGKKLFSFGRRDRSAVDGFGSCCNPMNLRCCSNGDILAAESSIGNIKRFNSRGEFVSLVGKARIGGGCKHVALAVDESRDRYYFMNVDKAHIAVLVPVSQIPPETEAEKAARLALAAQVQRLDGAWTREGLKTDKKARSGNTSSIGRLIGALFGSDEMHEMPTNLVDRLTFAGAGKASAKGGVLGMYAEGGELGWESVRLEGNNVVISILHDGTELLEATIEFVSDDELRIRTSDIGYGDANKPCTLQRVKP
jgi:hypothetical protein